MTYIAPQALAGKFTCPHCAAISEQKWDTCTEYLTPHIPGGSPIRIGHCTHCEEYTIWHWDDLLYPNFGVAPPPNPDMPEPVLQSYNEAARIATSSPRGAAALLRLAVQQLCIKLGEPGKNINSDIGALVQRGLPPNVQEALDIVRVTGNSAVHPGQIDVDSADTVSSLFSLLNLVVEYMITFPKHISETYENLPEAAKAAIENRDKPEN